MTGLGSDEDTSRLSKEREPSNIPRGDMGGASETTWLYPSSQMFYNALKRKGYETPLESIDTLVSIHNLLNERVWEEVLRWEKLKANICPSPKLAKFTGRPQELSPKARFYTWMGVEAPFDRHDWIVDRCGKPVRYVIDYYSGVPEPDGSPTMHYDVRPALDNFENLFHRLAMSFKEFKETYLV